MPKPTYEELEQKIKQLEAEIAGVRRTEREQAIRELKWQWQTTFDAVGAAICVLDPDWAVLQCNQATMNMLGKSPEEIIGRKCYELVHGEARPHENCPARRLVETKKRETEVLHLGERWVEIAADPILDDHGTLKGIVHIMTDITKHRAAAESIEKGESTLKSIFKAAPTGIGMVVDRVIMQANDRLCEMTGYRREELIGQSARMLYPTDEAFEYVGREKYRQIDERATGTVETRWRRMDGEILDVLLSSTPLNSEDLSQGVTFTALDITERKRAEAAMEMFKSAAEASSDAIGMSTSQGRHWYQNEAFDDLFGQIGEDPPATLYVDQAVGREVFQTIMAGNPWSGEVEMYGKDGNKLQILLRAYAVKDHPGKVTSLVGVHTDITERKRFVGELQRSEQRFRALAELLPQTVFEMQTDGRLTFVNNNALKIFGYTIEEFEQGLNALDMLVPEDRDKVQAAMGAVLRGETGHDGWRFTAMRKDGSTFPVLIYSSVSTDEHGKIGLRGIIIDISEQEKLVQERDKFEEQYIQAQKMEAVGRLAGGVAHDLNNMLSPIVGYGELLLDAIPSDAPDREAIGQMLGAGLRAKDMVRQLLAFSRKQALEIRSVNLNQILAGFESLLDRILRDDIQLELKLSRGIPDILADAGQIEQVVMNLAVNAQDAMPDGGKITIVVGMVELDEDDIQTHQMASAGRYVVLTFSDTGHGMDTETKERIFDPFFTTKGQGKGTGLGLATVYGIIKQHNGSIRVYSEPGKGAVFRAYFPVAPSFASGAPSEVQQPEKIFGTESVLIVEDNASVRKLSESILSKYGYQTIAVNGGRDCLQLLPQKHHFDLLLTDVVLQDTNGKELYDQVKISYPEIKVLYMSGYTDDVIVHHGILEEGISFIQKPFSVRTLLQKVREVLDA